MSFVEVVEVAIDEVIDMVTVGDGFVTAAGAVNMVSGMAGAGVAAGAGGGIGGGDFESVLVEVAFMGMVEVTIVKVIDVAVVNDGGVAAAGAMHMGVIGVNVVFHGESTFPGRVFRGVGQRVEDQPHDVLIGQRVEDVLALPSSREEVFGTQHPKALGDGGKLFTRGGGDFTDAGFALSQHGQCAQPWGIPHGPEDARGGLNGGLVDRGREALAVFGVVGSAGRGGLGFCFHLNNYSIESYHTDRNTQAIYSSYMNRREMMATTAGAPALAAAAATNIPTRVFGRTGEKLTVIGQAGGRFGMVSFDEAKAVTRRAYELGVNYFDCAHSYWGGRSEEAYGEALQDVRKKVFITTKSERRDKVGAMRELELSLKRLRTDYVDLWQIHAVGEMEEVDRIFAPGGAIEAFEEAKRKGMCRFMGFTGHRDPHVHLAMLARYEKYDTILFPLHPAEPSYLSFEKLVLPEAVKRGLGIQAMKSTANSKLLQRFSLRECLEYVLSLPVHCLALGCTTLGQIEDDVRIAQSLKPMDEPQRQALRAKAERFRLGGPGLEDWKRDTTVAAHRQRPYIGG